MKISILKWFMLAIIKLPIHDILAFIIVPIAVPFSKRIEDRMVLPKYVSWFNDPSEHGNEGEAWWRQKFNHEGSNYQMIRWLWRNRAMSFGKDYLDVYLGGSTYKLWGNQSLAILKTGWMFASATTPENKTYWHFKCYYPFPFKIKKAFSMHCGWGFIISEKTTEFWDEYNKINNNNNGDHSMSIGIKTIREDNRVL